MCYGDKEGDFMEFVAFYLGDINIYWYGLIIVFALLIGLGISKIMFKSVKGKSSSIGSLSTFPLINAQPAGVMVLFSVAKPNLTRLLV